MSSGRVVACDGCETTYRVGGGASDRVIPPGWWRLSATLGLPVDGDRAAAPQRRVVDACSPICAARALDLLAERADRAPARVHPAGRELLQIVPNERMEA